MFGRLPRLHRWVLVVLSMLTGTGLGAWVSHWSLRGADYSCTDVLVGICLAPSVNLVPVLVGAGLGLMAAVWLTYQPDQPRRLPVDRNSSRRHRRR
jgi:hypothetical protein